MIESEGKRLFRYAWFRWVRRVLPVLVFGLLLTGSLTLRQWRAGDEQFRGQARFNAEVSEIRADIEDGLRHYEHLLRAGEGVLTAAGSALDRAGWQRFVTALDLKNRYPGAAGLCVVLPLDDRERSSFEERQRTHTPGFEIVPDGIRPDYRVITLVAPEGRTTRAAGFDVGTLPAHQAALERSRDTAESILSNRLAAQALGEASADFVLYRALYRDGVRPAGVTERKDALTGWVGVRFNLGAGFKAVADSHPGIDIDIYDGETSDRDRIIYDSIVEEIGRTDISEQTHFSQRINLSMGGRSWLLVANSSRAFDASVIGNESTVIFYAGALFSLLAGLVIYVFQGSRDGALALIEDATANFNRSEARYRRVIDTAVEGYWELDAYGRTIAVNEALCRMLGYRGQDFLGKTPDDFAENPNRGDFTAFFAASSASPRCSFEMMHAYRVNAHTH
ncbi:MAG: CHASE domain-containing protein [Rhodospirillaceae bacterium]